MRKLRLSKEELTFLTEVELEEVAAAAATQLCPDVPDWGDLFTHTTSMDCVTKRICA